MRLKRLKQLAQQAGEAASADNRPSGQRERKLRAYRNAVMRQKPQYRRQFVSARDVGAQYNATQAKLAAWQALCSFNCACKHKPQGRHSVDSVDAQLFQLQQGKEQHKSRVSRASPFVECMRWLTWCYPKLLPI